MKMAGEMIAPEFLDLAQRYGVNVQGVVQAVYQPFYDRLSYAAAGQTELVFFQNPVGQNSKTLEDTNMRAAGQIPAPQQFLCTQVCVDFVPGVNPFSIAGTVADSTEYLADVWTFFKSGWLELNVGSKNQLTDAPVGKFPPTHVLEVTAAVSGTTTADTVVSSINYASNKGVMYDITPINIPWAQNFDVSLRYNTAVPLPSNTIGKVRVTLNGFLYRLAQ